MNGKRVLAETGAPVQQQGVRQAFELLGQGGP
jgi:hypothetical protein